MKSNSNESYWGLRQSVGLLSVCGIAWVAVSCDRTPHVKEFSALSSATRIEIQTSGVRPLSVINDPERIKVATDFIKHYEHGWISRTWQGGVIPRRHFDFWNGEHYLGEFGINPDSLTTDNYYQKVSADEITRLAKLFELEWPPRE